MIIPLGDLITSGELDIYKPVIMVFPSTTPQKFNMEPEEKSLEKEIPNLETIIFRFHVKFRGGVPLNYYLG